MPSASLQPSVIDQYLLTELNKGRVAGPFAIAPIPKPPRESLWNYPEEVPAWKMVTHLGFV